MLSFLFSWIFLCITLSFIGKRTGFRMYRLFSCDIWRISHAILLIVHWDLMEIHNSYSSSMLFSFWKLSNQFPKCRCTCLRVGFMFVLSCALNLLDLLFNKSFHQIWETQWLLLWILSSALFLLFSLGIMIWMLNLLLLYKTLMPCSFS